MDKPLPRTAKQLREWAGFGELRDHLEESSCGHQLKIRATTQACVSEIRKLCASVKCCPILVLSFLKLIRATVLVLKIRNHAFLSAIKRTTKSPLWNSAFGNTWQINTP